MTYTEKELDQFLHGISLSLLSKKSAQHWRYDEETAKEIEWLEALERKVRADKADRKEVKTMDDLISRQAAIRWVKTECNPYGKPTLDFESGKRVMEHLAQMPSAEPCDKDAISREGLLKSWEELSPRGRTEFDQVIMTIPALPSADRPQGEWKSKHNGYWTCSECGLSFLFYAKGNYCPNCGARMKGADDAI